MDGTMQLAVHVRESGSGVAAAAAALVPEVFATLAAAEAPWRELERGPGVLMTPYQRFDWVAAYAATVGLEGGRLCLALLRDDAGRPRVLLPLVVRREAGIRVARVVGGRHANYHMPVFAGPEAAALPAETLRRALARLGRSAGIDLFLLVHQPRRWDGAPNPLAALGSASPSDAYGLALGPDPEAVLRRVLSGDARRKLRQKEKWLAAAHGPVAHRVAADAPETAAILEAYFAQKAARFAQLGIPDPFADPAARAFVAAACRPGRDGAPPALELHALTLLESGRVLATFAGAVDARRFSGMLTSFDPDPGLARFSPGDLLLQALVRDQAARGRSALDLGVGEARYKSSVCDETIGLVDAHVPVTLRGALLARATAGALRLKRRIKRDPRLWALVGRLRRRRP
ncbi:GNAT family N-acetyltransferase [Methylobacterium crusticola]|nr:GNAT family N-acetyltransferase [Methylobacterium crusticola]